MNAPTDAPLAKLDPNKAADNLLAALTGRPAQPPQPQAARRVNGAAMQDDDDQPTKERDMPRGVYDRKKKGQGGVAKDAEPKQRRKRATNGVADETTELVLEAAQLLHAAIDEHLDVTDHEPVVKAMRFYALAEKLHRAAKA